MELDYAWLALLLLKISIFMKEEEMRSFSCNFNAYLSSMEKHGLYIHQYPTTTCNRYEMYTPVALNTTASNFLCHLHLKRPHLSHIECTCKFLLF